MKRSIYAPIIAVLIALLVIPTAGCNKSTVQSVAQQIVTWTPTIASAANLVAQSVSALEPQDKLIIAESVSMFATGSNLISTQAAAYLANPNQTTLAALETQVTTFQSQVNTALLQAARIVNPNSQQNILLEIQGVAVGVNAVLALLVNIKGSTVTPASATAVKLAQVMPLMDRQLAVRMVAAHYQESELFASARISYGQYTLEQAGF